MLDKILARCIAQYPGFNGTPCLVWQGAKTTTGYGQKNVNGKPTRIHRIVYEAAKGAIPTALHIDHLCRNRACCNIAHLEAVTRGENVLRGFGAGAKNKRKTHCHKGHPFSPENTERDSRGYRVCRTCKRQFRDFPDRIWV